MAKILFHADHIRFTNGVSEIELDVADYRGCLAKIHSLYPELQDDVLSRYMVTIDGVIIQSPFLEKLGPDSDLVFINKIAAG